jgi:hypothetical protein
MLLYAVAVRGGYREASAGCFQYLARQSGEQSSIGFQPVSSHQPASLLCPATGAIVLERYQEARLQDNSILANSRAELATASG